LLVSLPFTFVFGSLPSEPKLDATLPAALFTGELEARLIFRVNARMTDG
jgi:hypothetical protein